MIDNTLMWKSHIEMIIQKLSVVCLAVTAITPFVGLVTLKMVYRFYLHSVINYGIIFWGNFHIVIVFSNYKRELLRLSRV
jgi:hypothetical protein